MGVGAERPGVDPDVQNRLLRFRGGLVFKAHRLLYHSTLGLRLIKKKKNRLLPAVGISYENCFHLSSYTSILGDV